MLIFDIICQILFNEHKKYVVNLLCRPVISSKEVNENELNDFYKLYDNTEFVKSTLGIQNLLKIENKNNSDNELITLYNKHTFMKFIKHKSNYIFFGHFGKLLRYYIF